MKGYRKLSFEAGLALRFEEKRGNAVNSDVSEISFPADVCKNTKPRQLSAKKNKINK